MAQHSFHRGSLALDFVGTVGRRESTPEERLPDPAALESWLRDADLATPGIDISAEQFRLGIEIREAAAAVLAAVADSRALPAHPVRRLNHASSLLPAPQLDAKTGRRASIRDDFTVAMARIASDAIAVAADHRERLVRCSLPECRSLLLSGTVGERRKWCSMERCGNLAKVRAYRERNRTIA